MNWESFINKDLLDGIIAMSGYPDINYDHACEVWGRESLDALTSMATFHRSDASSDAPLMSLLSGALETLILRAWEV